MSKPQRPAQTVANTTTILPPPGLRLRHIERERTIQAPGGARCIFDVEDGYDITVHDGVVVVRKDEWCACFSFAGCHGTPLL